MKKMYNIIIHFIIASVILFQELIPTEVNILDLLNKASVNNSQEHKNYMQFSFGVTFSCEFLYRYNMYPSSATMKKVNEANNVTTVNDIFYLRIPMQYFSSMGEFNHFITIRTNQIIFITSDNLTEFHNSVDFIRNKKFANFYHKEMFDGNWHKIVFYYESGYAWMEFDCSKSRKQILEDTFEDIIYSYDDDIVDYRKEYQTFFELSDKVQVEKFIIYDELPQSVKCKDLQKLARSLIGGPKLWLSQKRYTKDDWQKLYTKDDLYFNNSDCKARLDESTFRHRTIKWKREYEISPHKEECVESSTLVRGTKTCEKVLIFEDDFYYFDEAQWEHEIRIPLDSDDAEFVSYQDHAANCNSDGGNLILMPTFLDELSGFDERSIRLGELSLGSNCTVLIDEKIECYRKAQYFRILPPIVSAKIRTKKSFSFRYGRIDVRAKLPKGDWIFPQIFLEPLTSDYGSGSYKSGQMRIAFIRSNEYLLDKNLTRIDGARLSGGVVLSVGELTRDMYFKHSLQLEHLSTNYHVYSMIWTDQSITFFLNGKQYGRIDGGFQEIPDIPHAHLWKRGEFMAPFDQEFYISLGVSVGGISDFPDGSQTGKRKSPKPWQNTNPKGELNFWNNVNLWQGTWRSNDISMKVDYVRVWAL